MVMTQLTSPVTKSPVATIKTRVSGRFVLYLHWSLLTFRRVCKWWTITFLCFVYWSRILKEKTDGVCVVVMVWMCTGKPIRSKNLNSDNDYSGLSFPSLLTASFKIVLKSVFCSNPNNWHYASEMLTKSCSESLKFKIGVILIGCQNLTIIIPSAQNILQSDNYCLRLQLSLITLS